MNTYIINSESFHIIKEEISKIVKKEKNVTKYNYLESSIKEIIEDASYNSLFNDKKYIIIENADFLGKEKLNDDDTKLLLKYLNEPSANTILVFVSNLPIDEKNKITKFIKETGIVIVHLKMKTNEILNYVDSYVKKNKKSISFKGINYIIECCNNNLDLIINEIDKLLLLDNEIITDDELYNIISKDSNISNFDFSDAVIEKNITKAYAILEDLKINKEDVSLLVALLASQYRLILSVKHLIKSGYTNNQINSELKIHPFRVQLAIKNGRNYSFKELEDIIIELSSYDIKIKKHIIADYNALELFLLNLKNTIY